MDISLLQNSEQSLCIFVNVVFTVLPSRPNFHKLCSETEELCIFVNVVFTVLPSRPNFLLLEAKKISILISNDFHQIWWDFRSETEIWLWALSMIYSRTNIFFSISSQVKLWFEKFEENLSIFENVQNCQCFRLLDLSAIL